MNVPRKGAESGDHVSDLDGISPNLSKIQQSDGRATNAEPGKDIAESLNREGLSLATFAARRRLPERDLRRLFEEDGLRRKQASTICPISISLSGAVSA